MCHVCLVTQCLTLYNPMDCSPPISSLHGDSPGKSAGVGCHAFLKVWHKQAQILFCKMLYVLPSSFPYILIFFFYFLNNFLFNCKRLEEAHIIKEEYKSVTKI